MRVCHLHELDLQTYTRLMQRSASEVQQVLPQVQAIMDDVRQRGDAALREYSVRFDGVELEHFQVTPEEIAAAREQVDSALIDSLQQARDNLERFHRQQLPHNQMHELQPGVQTGRIWRPIEKVGLYAPGGKAPYPSTVLMLGTPALVAGCPQRVLCKHGRDLEVFVNGNAADVMDRLRVRSPETLTIESLTLEEIFITTLRPEAARA
jgi:histidinol dehydrogenase